MIIDTHLHPTNIVDEAWRHTGEPFTGERMIEMMDGPTGSTASRVASTWASSSPLQATRRGETVDAPAARADATTWPMWPN